MRASLPFSVILSGWLESPNANRTCPAANACTTFAPPPGTTKSGVLSAFFLEELLRGGHQMLAIDEGRDAVRRTDGLEALGRGTPGSARTDEGADARGQPGGPEEIAPRRGSEVGRFCHD